MLLAANNDRVRESTSTVGAGDLALLGAVVGFRAFSAVLNDQDVRPYTIEGLNSGGGPSGEWETGLGTYNAGLNTLSRTTVLASSNAGAAVVFSAGAKQVWIDAPAAFLSGLLQAGNNLSDVANVATARHSLGLDAVDAPTFAGLTLTGVAALPAGTAAAPSVSLAGTSGFFTRTSPGGLVATVGGVQRGGWTTNNSEFQIIAAGILSWSSTATVGAASDLALSRDAPNILAQRNGVNAQAFRAYNTFTDASNYERVAIDWQANAGVASIQTAAAGTGTLRNLRLAGAAVELGIVGAGIAWTVNASRNFVAATDNSFDIGAAGATRPRNIFAAGGVGLKVKAGAIIDTDFTNPTDGMIAADSTNSKLWMRLGGVWKSVVLA